MVELYLDEEIGASHYHIHFNRSMQLMAAKLFFRNLLHLLKSSRWKKIQIVAILNLLFFVYMWVVLIKSTNCCDRLDVNWLLQGDEDNERNGDLYELETGFSKNFFYSAFYDNRTSLGRFNQIRVIALVQTFNTKPISNFQCTFWNDVNSSQPTYSGSDFMSYKETRPSFHSSVGDFGEYILSCRLPSLWSTIDLRSRLKYVSIKDNSTQKDSERLRIHYPRTLSTHEKNPSSIINCLSIAHGQINLVRLIEWLELLKELSMTKVFVHYHEYIDQRTLRVLRYYQSEEQFVALRRIGSPAALNKILSKKLLAKSFSTTSINDCLYRSMHLYSQVAVFDFDEIILPRQDANYGDLLQRLKTAYPHCTGFSFRNAYFFSELENQKTASHSKSMLYLRHRLHVSPFGYSAKSIIDPQVCEAMQNHYCWKFTPYQNDTINCHVDHVDTKYGLNQHYKKCHFDEYEKPGICKKYIDEGVVEDSYLVERFGERLLERVTKKLEILTSLGYLNN